MSDTSPTDRARIEMLSGGDPYRQLMLEKMFEVTQEASENKAWRLAHDKADDARFAEINSELLQIKAKAGTVSLSVNDLETDRAKVIASWKTLAWAVGALTALALTIDWLGRKVISALGLNP